MLTYPPVHLGSFNHKKRFFLPLLEKIKGWSGGIGGIWQISLVSLRCLFTVLHVHYTVSVYNAAILLLLQTSATQITSALTYCSYPWGYAVKMLAKKWSGRKRKKELFLKKSGFSQEHLSKQLTFFSLNLLIILDDSAVYCN